MKRIEINANYRTDFGKSYTKKLRKRGFVPGVLYGGEKLVHFEAFKNEFLKLVYTPEVLLIDLNIDGDKYFCYKQDIQFHPVNDSIIHIDFIEINEKEPIKISLPIEIVGQSVGIKAGGKLKKTMRLLKVKGLVNDLPEKIEVDITKLQIGQNIKVRQLSLTNIDFLDPSSSVVAQIKSARGVAALPGEEDETEESETTENENSGEETAVAE